MRLSFRLGLYLGFIAVVVVPTLIAIVLFGILLRRSAVDEFYNRAERVGVGILKEISNRNTALVRLARRYAADPAIVAALETGARAGLKDRLVELFGYSDLDLLEAGDVSGFVLARGHRPGDFGEGKGTQRIIRDAVEGRPGADIEYGVSGIALRAVAPVLSGKGSVLGTVMAGVLLNRDFFMEYKTISGFDIALYRGSDCITDTWPQPFTWTPPPPSAGEGPIPWEGEFSIGGHAVWGVSLPVRHVSGERFGSLLLWQDRTSILSSLRINQLALLYTCIVSAVLSLILAALLGRGFSSPLKKLAPVMERIARGDLREDMPDLKWTEFKELGRRFRQMIAELRQARETVEKTQRQLVVAGKLAVLGQVTAELAHEIRNPLNSLEISTRLLEAELSEFETTGPRVSETLRNLRAEIRRLKRTVSEFVEAGGEIVVRRKAVDIACELREIVAIARPQIELLGIAVEMDIEAGRDIMIDHNRLHQAMLNIILNACQSMKPGGRLSIRGREVSGSYVIAVSDTGMGMTGQEQKEIYDFPFSAKAEGMGCGLRYVLRIMRAHGGELDIESFPGRGTTVRLIFPKK